MSGLDSLAYRLRPAQGTPEGALVLFHGRGADENDLFPLLDLLDPERRFVGATLRGPLSLPPGGAHWYIVREIGYPDKETFDTSYALGLGRDRPRPAALIALSGFIPSVEGFELDLSPPLPPVAIGHGTFDPVISVEWSRRAKEQLEQAGADVLYREYPLAHSIDPRYLSELSSWLSALAPTQAPTAE